MKSSFFNSFTIFVFISIFILIFSICLFFPILVNSDANFNIENLILPNINFDISGSSFSWPVPGYNKITSYFGYRDAPTSGASTYHSGIDIAAPVRFKYNFNF